MKNVFSKYIYKQTIKKLSFVAILTTIISIMITLVIININFGADGRYMPLVIRYYYFQLYGSSGFTAAGLAPFLIAVMFIGSMLFTYQAFKYQNKRVLADKYHSLPYTRVEQYVSRILAVLTLLYAIIIITLLTSYINIIILNLTYIPKYYILSALGYMAGTTLIVGITAAAMSITGNIFANLTVGAVFLFLPRSILFMISMLISRVSNHMVSINDLNVLLSPSTNIPVGIVLDITELWTYNGTSETLITGKGIIFTFALAIVYLALALYLSNRRKSELAVKSFINPTVSFVFASLCALPIVAFSGYSFASSIVYGKGTVEALRGTVPALIVFAVLLFIIISIIYNAKPKGLIKGFIIFAFISMLGYGIIAGGVALANGVTHKEIKNDKVDYVTVNLSGSKDYVNTPVYTYGVMMAKDVKIYDEDIINALIENYKIVEQQLADDPISVYYNYNRSRNTDFWCEFHMKSGNTIVRNIPVYSYNDALDNMLNVLLDNDKYYEALYSLPAADDSSNRFDDTVDQKIYEVYLNEVDELSQAGKIAYEALPSYLLDRFSEYDYAPSGTVNYISISGMYNDTPYINHLPVSNYVPKTKRMYMQETALIYYDSLMDTFEGIEKSKKNEIELYITFSFDNYVEALVYNNKLDYYNAHLYESFDYDRMLELISDLKAVDVNAFDENDYYVAIEYTLYIGNKDLSGYTYLPLDKEMYDYWLNEAENLH